MVSVINTQKTESGLYTGNFDCLIGFIKSNSTGHIQVEPNYGGYRDVESLAWEICSAVPEQTFEFYIAHNLFGIKWGIQEELIA